MENRAGQTEPPLGEIMSCVNFNLKRTSRALTQLYNHWLKPSGLLITQFSLLAVLRMRGNQPISQLAEELMMDRTTLSRNLRPLERQGWVALTPDATDRRVQIVTLTDAGLQAFLAALPYWRAAQAHIATELGGDNVEQLLAQLHHLNAIQA